MREILFRGQSIDRRKWYEGDLYQTRLKSVFYINYYTEHGDRMAVEVDPETVGQYTGLTDKNGKKIFEGDIVDTPDRLIEVVWLGGNAQFDLKFIRYAHDTRITNFKGIAMRDLIEYEVIGNIHDNPELLKGGVDNAR